MINATAGVWLNYATTVAFQILFAARYGSSGSASSFVVAFGLVIGAGGIATATTQSIVVPRLVGKDGALHGGSLRLVMGATCALAAIFGLVALAPHVLAGAIGGIGALSVNELESVLRPAAAFGLLQTIAAQFSILALARGHRFLPAVAPAIPTTAAIALLAAGTPNLADVFVALAVGAAVEAAIVAPAAFRSARFGFDEMPPFRLIAFITAGQFSLLALLPMFERVLASIGDPEGPAQLNYALRSLVIVQQLILGGLVLASLGDWSSLAQGARDAFRTSVAKRLAVAAGALLLAGSLGVVLAHPLVGLVYERGQFTAHDSEMVALLLLLALPGFVAEGVGLVASQALIAARRNGTAVAIGIGNASGRLALGIALALSLGARGVAISYSVVSGVVLIAQLVCLARLRLLDARAIPLARRVVAVGTPTVLVALLGGELGLSTVLVTPLVLFVFLGSAALSKVPVSGGTQSV